MEDEGTRARELSGGVGGRFALPPDSRKFGMAEPTVRRFRYGIGAGLGVLLLGAVHHALRMVGVELGYLTHPQVLELTLVAGGVILLVASVAGLLERARKSERAVQEESERWRSVMENIPSAVVLLEAGDPDEHPSGERVEMDEFRCVALNSPARTLLGIEALEAAPTAIWGEERPVLQSLERALADSVEVSYTDRSERHDGVKEIEGRVIPLGERPHRRVLVVEEDVTDRRQLEAQYQQAQKMEAVGQLAGGVAHDFNNRLTVIHGSCQMLLDELDEDSPLGTTLAQVLRETEQAAVLTRQLLAFSRRQVLDEQVLDVSRLIHEMQPMVRRLIPERIEVELQGEDEGCRVLADRNQIEQVILNLVVNAADAIEGQGRITIGVSQTTLSAREAEAIPWAVDPGSYVELRVGDTGSGMPKEVRDRVFEPFFTTKPEGRGTGLGLSMVYGSVKQSGGHVLIDSEPGVGTLIRVLLPLAQEGERDRRPSQPKPVVRPAPRAAPADGSGTILVVDDEGPVLNVASRILERAGYVVLGAGSGQEALDRIQEGDPAVDLVVSDLVMPGMSGTELVDRIEELPAGPPVVLMSGHSEAELGEAGRRKAARFLDKPFTPDTLVEVVSELLTLRREGEPALDPSSTSSSEGEL